MDAPPFTCNLAVSPDGAHVYLPLAGDGAPDNEARHRPNAPRWLKIYELDVATGAKRAVAGSSDEDNSDPAVVEELRHRAVEEQVLPTCHVVEAELFCPAGVDDGRCGRADRQSDLHLHLISATECIM